MSEVITWDQLSVRSRDILLACVHDTFFWTAVDDYIAARGLWHYGMFNSFCWLAGQTLEKFIKAALLLNGYEAKGKKHKFCSEFGLLQKNSRSLIPEMVELPEKVIQKAFSLGISPEKKGNESFKDCLARFEENGDPNQRYNQVGHDLDTFDLHKFDFMCLHISRLSLGLNTLKIKGAMNTPIANQTFDKFKDYIAPRSSVSGLNIQKVLENQNYAFLKDPPSNASTLAVSLRQSVLEFYKRDKTKDAKDAIEYLCSNSPVS